MSLGTASAELTRRRSLAMDAHTCGSRCDRMRLCSSEAQIGADLSIVT